VDWDFITRNPEKLTVKANEGEMGVPRRFCAFTPQRLYELLARAPIRALHGLAGICLSAETAG
jgi:hypothetical protein